MSADEVFNGSQDLDVLIVGGGHNGLVAAVYLAQAGLRVQVLEAGDAVGGACKTEELIPGYRFSTCANWVGWWRPKVIEDLRLLERGLAVGGADIKMRVLEGNRPFVWWSDERELVAEIASISPNDARRWTDWRAIWQQARDLLGPFLLSYPPSFEDLMCHAERTGRGELLSMLMTSSIAELADRHFESEEMRSSVGAPHDVGSLYDHGSALIAGLSAAALEYSETGKRAPSGFVRGGMGEIVRALVEAGTEVGVSIRTAAPVERILVEDGRAVGVRLLGGEEIGAASVISNTDPRRTFLELLPAAELDAGFRHRVQQLRTDVAPLKLHCALSELPEWSAFAGSDLPYPGTLSLLGSRRQHELAWDAARHGELPDAPYMEVMTPSFWDDTLAPAGHHTLSFWTLYAPVRPAKGTWRSRHEEMLERLLSYVSRFSPNFREALVNCYLLTPQTLEERVLLTNGNIHHVDISPPQILWQRPLLELARYRSPLAGLYQCGASQHPYGEVSGGPGHNAAHAVLEDHGVIAPGSWQQVQLGQVRPAAGPA